MKLEYCVQLPFNQCCLPDYYIVQPKIIKPLQVLLYTVCDKATILSVYIATVTQLEMLWDTCLACLSEFSFGNLINPENSVYCYLSNIQSTIEQLRGM